MKIFIINAIIEKIIIKPKYNRYFVLENMPIKSKITNIKQLKSVVKIINLFDKLDANCY